MALATPLRTQHLADGAQLAEYFGCVMPERFSDGREEYGFARKTVAVVDKGYRAWFDFTGPDRTRYLHAILSNNVRDLATGQGTVSLLLNPQGHILAEVETYVMEDRIRAVTHRMVRERTAEILEKFIIMDDVVLEDLTDQLGAIALEGPKTPEVLAALAAPPLGGREERSIGEVEVAGVRCQMVRRSPGGTASAEFIAAQADLPQLWQELRDAARAHGGGPVGYAALNSLRLEQGVPWYGYDFDESVIPQEAALENTHISFTKGCYPGQEIVERVRSRGHVNRRRVGLAFGGNAIPAARTPLLAGDVEVGHVTRAGFSYALSRPIGMGYLRREYTAPGSRVAVAGEQAEVIVLPVEVALPA
jgi:folate-binding protein YgfZ